MGIDAQRWTRGDVTVRANVDEHVGGNDGYAPMIGKDRYIHIRYGQGAKLTEITFLNRVNGVAFTEDGNHVVAGDAGGEVRRLRIEDGLQHGRAMRASECIRALVVSKDGRWIVTGDEACKVIVWNTDTHEKAREIAEHTDCVIALDVSSDSTTIASGSDNRVVLIFDLTSGVRLIPPLHHDNGVHGVKFSPDGNLVATATWYHNSVRVYNLHTGEKLFDIPTVKVKAWPITPLVWSSDGQRLFAVSSGKITCLDLSTTSLSEWSIHNADPRASIATNGKFIACSAGSLITLWDSVSHKQIGTVITHPAETSSIALSSNGRYLACGDDRTVTIYSLSDILPPSYFSDLSPVTRLPLMHISDNALESWTQGDPMTAEKILSEEIARALKRSHHTLANRALIRARSKKWVLAIDDAKDSLQIQASPIGHIAMAVALLGQGNQESALYTFDLAFHDSEPLDIKFLLLLKSILVFESGNQEEAITRARYLLTRANEDNATYVCSQVLGLMYLKKGDYGSAVLLFETAKALVSINNKCPPLMTISLIFGWSFDRLDSIVRRCLWETHYAAGRPDEETQLNDTTVDLNSTDFSKRSVTILEHIGDQAFISAKYDDAIAQYSTALFLSPPDPTSLLIKRSRAQAAKGLWEDALHDANEAIKADPSSPWGYETKHVALHGAQRYDEAIAMLDATLSMIERSPDPGINQLRRHYLSRPETIAAVDVIVHGILKISPLVLIDVKSGRLCDGFERMRIFKDDPAFKELISSMTREVDNERILRVVTRYFGYVTFSHVWQGNEPSFQDVNLVGSVWNLDPTPLNDKLRRFCEEVRELGYRWAWSDTCCIDKTPSSVLNQSLASMYKWYEDSAMTLVLLASVAHPSKLGDLTLSPWMKRSWTLQEFLAPNVIRFYDREWKPYLGDTRLNHKESPEIMRELADAIQIPARTIVTFCPDDLGVREKLRLASTRNATREEDVAYSLIGIFRSDIRPQYGEREAALGHLLQEIVARSGKVSVLAWTGKSSPFNSCLPASLAVYFKPPYTPPSVPSGEINGRVSKLRKVLPPDQALLIYERVTRLPPARFANRRLHLPCIIYRVRTLSNRSENLYCAKVSVLGELEFQTVDLLPLAEPRTLVIVFPWIPDLLHLLDQLNVSEDSSDSSNTEYYTDSAPSSPSEAVPSLSSNAYYTREYELIARLESSFSALLFQQVSHQEYRRVAADAELVVQGFRRHLTSSKDIRVEVLEVL